MVFRDLQTARANMDSCMVVSMRYPSELDRWLGRKPASDDDDDYTGWRTERIPWSLRSCASNSRKPCAPSQVVEGVRAGGRRRRVEMLYQLRRFAVSSFRCLNLFVHQASEVYGVLDHVRHILRYNYSDENWVNTRWVRKLFRVI